MSNTRRMDGGMSNTEPMDGGMSNTEPMDGGMSNTERTARWAIGVRLVAALVFLLFGAGKFTNHASELASFRAYGLPAPEVCVYAIGVLEILGGLLLSLGLWTRPTAALLAGDMMGAIVVSGLGRGEIISLTLAPLLLAGMIFVIRAGPGGWSLRALRPRRRQSRGS